ncbi:MAG: hypothetical protein G01um101438_945 [Parcubacteria group bacterium Gr01-1014_38]|nr:MAG: hypothetical protein G01um101438_945 [Parcubacteria group bacterium Gr01-1014_38]
MLVRDCSLKNPKEKRMSRLPTSPPTSDAAPEAVERLRLECFQNMLDALGLLTDLRWKDTTYRLKIQRSRRLWFPFRRTIQTLARDTRSTKPHHPWSDWNLLVDCYTECALTSLYRGALECALEAFAISLELTNEMRDAVAHFPSNLAYGLHAFPVREEISGRHIFHLVCATALTETDHEFAHCIWPGIEMCAADSEEYRHVHTYLQFFIERYFSGVRTPYGENGGCGCLDTGDL